MKLASVTDEPGPRGIGGETQLVDAIVDVHLTSFTQLESGGLRDTVDLR